jgi:hypothetical protein
MAKKTDMNHPAVCCTWCNKSLIDEESVLSLNIKAGEGSRFTDFAGQFISIALAAEKRDVHAFVTTEDSQARKDGFDLLFIVCSEECRGNLKIALKEETF